MALHIPINRQLTTQPSVEWLGGNAIHSYLPLLEKDWNAAGSTIATTLLWVDYRLTAGNSSTPYYSAHKTNINLLIRSEAPTSFFFSCYFIFIAIFPFLYIDYHTLHRSTHIIIIYIIQYLYSVIFITNNNKFLFKKMNNKTLQMRIHLLNNVIKNEK